MGIVKLNMAKLLESTAGNTMFVDVPKDGEIRVRLLPPVDGNNGQLWYLTENHFRLKAEDGEKGIAIACNNRHGEGNCLLCSVADYLKNSDDKVEQKIGDGRESIKANRNWYAQVLMIDKVEKDFVAGPVKFVRLPKTGADAVNAILQSQQKNDDALSCMPEAAQDIIIRRQDTGVPRTTYSAMPTGKPKSLDEYLPGWADKILTSEQVWAKLDIKVFTNEEQAAAFARSYPLVDTAAMLKELGYAG
jgi:hypothetical protein